jgi:hypothetical protein
MAQAATPLSRRPERKPPELDLATRLPRREAGPAVVRQVLALPLPAVQADVTLQAGHARELIALARHALVVQGASKPETVQAGAEAAERGFAVAGPSRGRGIRARASVERLQVIAV